MQSIQRRESSAHSHSSLLLQSPGAPTLHMIPAPDWLPVLPASLKSGRRQQRFVESKEHEQNKNGNEES